MKYVGWILTASIMFSVSLGARAAIARFDDSAPSPMAPLSEAFKPDPFGYSYKSQPYKGKKPRKTVRKKSRRKSKWAKKKKRRKSKLASKRKSKRKRLAKRAKARKKQRIARGKKRSAKRSVSGKRAKRK